MVNKMSLRKAFFLCVFFLAASSFFISINSHASVTSAHWIADEVFQSTGSPGGGYNFNNVLLSNVYIDPDMTNWIAWHDKITPTLVSGQEYVGSYDWLGIDDWLYLTITNPVGTQSSRLQMSWNDGVGTYSGPQAIIYGQADTSPNIWRRNLYRTVQNYSENGLFNSFFTMAGDYSFYFEFYDGYPNSHRHPDMYLLVNHNVIPEPASLLLFGSGLLGAGLIRRRKK